MNMIKLTLLILLLAGSVQGQCYQIGAPSILEPDSLGPVVYGGFNNDPRLTDSDYWFFCEDQVRFYPSLWDRTGSLYRRLDRWYKKTTQVCDTVLDNNGSISDWNGGYSEWLCYKITCRDTTILEKRVKKTETKWVLPFQPKHFNGLEIPE